MLLIDDKPYNYGKQRLFGALSYGLFSFLAGYVIDLASAGAATKNYIYAFYLGFAMLLIDIVDAWIIKYNQKDHGRNIIGNVFQLLINPAILIYLTWCIIVGKWTYNVNMYLFLCFKHIKTVT